MDAPRPTPDKITDLKKRVADGTYEVELDRVAEAVLRSGLIGPPSLYRD